MENVSKQIARKAETPQHETLISSIPHIDAQPALAAHNGAEKDAIKAVKERLLSAGMMTIEPLEGDPFILSREHKSNGEGVTTYTPDGEVTTMSINEYQAELARGRQAAQFFERPKAIAENRERKVGVLKRTTSWLKQKFTGFFSKLFGF